MSIAFGILILSIFAGFFGALLGLGGGVMIVPGLTLLFGINIRYAIGASIVSVIATSSGAAATYVRGGFTNIRLAIFLEVATTLGALVGAMLSSYLKADALFVLFSLLLLHSAYKMWCTEQPGAEALPPCSQSRWAEKMRLNSQYRDRQFGGEVSYYVQKVPLGFLFMFGAGIVSALLGIGSGVLKVMALDSVMKLPIKVSAATSNFMIGVTAATSAGAFFWRGDILPQVAAPVAIGVLIGAGWGAKLMPRISAKILRRIFVFILVIIGIQMAVRGLSFE